MTRVVEPVCGFRWGYTTRNGTLEMLPLMRANNTTWISARTVLRERYPSWEFGAEWPDER
jgi:hypothetical protein